MLLDVPCDQVMVLQYIQWMETPLLGGSQGASIVSRVSYKASPETVREQVSGPLG